MDSEGNLSTTVALVPTVAHPHPHALTLLSLRIALAVDLFQEANLTLYPLLPQFYHSPFAPLQPLI